MADIHGKPVTCDDLYYECQARGIEIANHESDLYIPNTEETRALCKHFGKRPQSFFNQVTKTTWLDVPFAYTPFWEKAWRIGQSRKNGGKS